MRRTLLAGGALCAALTLGLVRLLGASAFTPGNIVVYRVGDGAAALTNSATAVFLDEYTPAGAFVQSVPMPTALSGANRRLTASGTATSEGFLTLSSDGKFLALTGYDAATGTATIAGTTSAAVNRVVGRVDSTATIDTTTAMSNAFSGNGPRSVATDAGTNFWVVGAVSGVQLATLGGTTASTVSTTSTNLRGASIFGGQLHISSGAGTIRVGTVGTGLPTASGTVTANLPGFPATPSVTGFYLADLSPAVAGVDTLYVADDGASQLQKYSLVSGSWVANGNVAVTSARGLTGSVLGTTVTLFGTSGSAGTTLYKFTDAAGYNATISGTVSNIASAGSNKAFRGVAFAPVGSTPPTVTGSATTNPVLAGNTTLLTATVTLGTNPASTGLAVNANLGSIGGSTTQQFFDDGTNGDVASGDNVFSFQATVASGTIAGNKSLPVTVTDAQSRSGATNIALTVTQPVVTTSPTASGSATPSSVSVPGDAVTFTVTVTPGANPDSTGLAVRADLTSIAGLANQPFSQNGNMFTFATTVPAGVTNGSKSIPVTVTDAQGRSGGATIALTVAFPTSPTATASASPSSVGQGEQSTLTVTVTPGTNPTSSGMAVRADLTAIGGSATQAFSGSGNVFTFTATVSPSTSTGSKSLPVTITDAQSRSGSASIGLSVVQTVQIGRLVISQVYGGGGNSGATYTNDFIEIFNPGSSPISLNGWSVQATSASSTSWTTNGPITPLSGTINPGQYYLVQESQGTGGTTPLPAADASGVITMSGTNAKVALVAGTAVLSGSCPLGGTVIDMVGYGSASCFETTATPTLSNTTAAVRKGNGCIDTDNNAQDFVVVGPIPRNSAAPLNGCGGDPTQPSGLGIATPGSVEPASITLLTVAVSPATQPPSTGLSVRANLTSIGGLGTQSFFDDGTHGDVTAGDNVFSFQATVGLLIATGAKNIVSTITDAQARSVTAPITLTIASATCGVERWSVKTGTDPDAGQVNLFNPPTRMSIVDLGAIPAPLGGDAGIPANARVAPTETSVYSLNGTMTLFKKEGDVDYHIVVTDASGHTLIGEIPSPACVGAASPFGPAVSAARAKFDARFAATTFFSNPPVAVPVQITGVGFFDFIHGQTGVAPNGIELHPMLDIAFTANTMTTLLSSSNPSQYGQGVSITATVSNTETAPVPTGHVTLFDGGLPLLSPVALDQNGRAIFNGLLPSVGSHLYTASYEGDSTAAQSTSAVLTQVVNKADQTITFAALGGMTYGDANFTVNATASSGLPVIFSIASGDPATVFGDSVHITGTGTVTVRASQAGDSNYSAAADVDRSFVVAKATPIFSDLHSPVVSDNPPVGVTLTARIGLLSLVPTGTVSVTLNSVVRTPSISPLGIISVSFDPVPAATTPYTIHYSYPGDENFNPATAVSTLTVIDQTAPIIAPHPNVTVEATSAAGATVAYGLPATTDNLDPPGVAACVPAVGSTFPLGATVVTCNASDANHNNAVPTTFTVAVVDTTGPAAPTLTVDHGVLWPPDHKFVPVTVTAHTTDAVSAAPVCSITGITMNDDDGRFSITGPLTANLLAEKIQDEDALVYRLAVSCTDAAGNTSQPAAINVIVPHDQGNKD
jgi:hypothetical protein